MTNARDLTNRLVELHRRELHAMAAFLVALAAFDQQRQWRELGYASLFAFLRGELGLSAGAAQYRKSAAELIQRFPEIETALRSGKLCLSSVIELAKVITEENAAEVLPRFFGKSARDAAQVAVSIRPVENPPTREIVAPLRASAASPVAAPSPAPARHEGTQPLRTSEVESMPASQGVSPSLDLRAPEAAPPPDAHVPRSTVDPLDAERARLHLTVTRRLLAKLEAAKDALSHARPEASTEEVLEASLDLLLAHHAKRKGMVERPRKPSRPVTSDAIPAAVRREAWTRAGGRCEWRLDAGGVCGSTVRLEFDHVTPRAQGGASTIHNVRVLCRSHNQLAARLVFGDAWMDRFVRKAHRTGVDEERPRGSGERMPALSERREVIDAEH